MITEEDLIKQIVESRTQEAVLESYVEGVQNGIKKTRETICKAMISNGLESNLIHSCTGLDYDEIANLKNKIKK